ncbi:MAG: MSMEG_1061 family FMN-dependent PPOX-type flavoprotein [Candidatus Promineifilaceae bacterium]
MMKTIKSVDELRELLGGEPSAAAAGKMFPHLSSQAEEFIGRSPFLMLSTRDTAGNVTISPKGDAAGFVYVADPHTIYIPERKGNRLIVSLQNILATGEVGLIFLVPNTSETLRISGRCEIVLDDALNQQMTDRRNKPALLALKITIEESYFHCAKALMRSGLWQPESWDLPNKVSFGREIAEKNGQCQTVVAEIDQYVGESYARSAEEEGMIG